MPLYSFFAKSIEGKEKKGVVEAQSLEELEEKLKEEGFFLVSAEEKKKKEKRDFLKFLSSISLKEKIFFTRNLSVMLSAGLSFTRALNVLSIQTKKKRFKEIILKIKDEIEKGKSFSESLSLFGDVFSDFYQSIAKIGEESGTLVRSLEIIAKKLERENELKARIVSALIYPAIVILAMIGVGILMLVFVIPKLAETFFDLGINLPLSTRLVISLGIFFQKNIVLLLFLFILFLLFLRFFLKTRKGKKLFSFFSLRIPIINQLVRNNILGSFLGNIATLISAGVPLPRALEITAESMGNVYYQESILDCKEKIKKGEKLSDSLKNFSSLYPAVLIEMITVGEETGESVGIFSRLALFYEKDVLRTTKNLTAIIEPVLILAMGVTIGFFAVSMIRPIYSLMGAIQ
ncbi:MAG: type II secretion system F family protein [Minisyncoccales bacterium]